MNRTTQSSLALTLAVASAFGAARAEAPKPAEAGRLEEVVVTAQRREEPAQSIGVALSVLSVGALEDVGVAKVNDLQNATPSLEVEPAFGSGQAQFRLRGVGFIDYTSNNSSPVAVNLDGVALPPQPARPHAAPQERAAPPQAAPQERAAPQQPARGRPAAVERKGPHEVPQQER